VTGVGLALVVFSIWAIFVTTAPTEQFQKDPKFASQYLEYYQGLAGFGSAMIIGGGILYYLHHRSMKQMEQER
jgi:hypothetical protein